MLARSGQLPTIGVYDYKRNGFHTALSRKVGQDFEIGLLASE